MFLETRLKDNENLSNIHYFSEVDYDENVIVRELVESQFVSSSCDVIMGLLTFVTICVVLQSLVLIAYFCSRTFRSDSYSIEAQRGGTKPVNYCISLNYKFVIALTNFRFYLR